MVWKLSVLAGLAAGLGVAGCAADSGSGDAALADSSLERLQREPEAAEPVLRTAEPEASEAASLLSRLEDVDVSALLREDAGREAAEAERPADVDPEPEPSPDVDQEPMAADLAAAVALDEPEAAADVLEDEPAVEAGPVVVPETPAETRARLVRELRGRLLADARVSADPFAALAGLAALELIEPGTLGRARALDESAFSELFPEQESMLGAMRELAEAFRSGDPDAAAEAAASVSGSLRIGGGLRLPVVALCTRVDGFGRYERFGSTRFVAGRSNEMILYVEVEGFAHQSARWGEASTGSASPVAADAWAVELTQSVELWRDRDDLLVWSQPVQRDRSISRSKRRDFFLVNRVVLPASVTTGRYTLRVRMRDAAQPGAVAEAAVPIEVVAE